jgi:hypothetical protein|nr:MAG TPA: virion morphogenesis protein [Caudoviricetes sp.]
MGVNVKASFQLAQGEMLKKLKRYAAGGTVTVGIHEDKTARNDGLTNAEIAAKNHFGSPEDHIPARPFLDVGIRKAQDKIVAFARRTVERGGGMDAALYVMGAEAVKGVRSYILEGAGVPPPNSPRTIERKGSSRTLVDTKQMVNAIAFKVHKQGGAS